MNSEDLFTGCKNRDQAAWTYAYNYVVFYLKGKQTAGKDIEDIAQNTILYFINGGLGIVQNGIAFKCLLRKKAGQCYIDFFRKAYHKNETAMEIQAKDSGQTFINPGVQHSDIDIESDLFKSQTLVLLDELVNTLDKLCMNTLKKYFKGKAEGWKIKEIAKKEKLNPNTFSARVNRCFNTFKAFPKYQNLLKVYKTD
jgi:DNA-directed RNA polymerase specialized sigma24 family protein